MALNAQHPQTISVAAMAPLTPEQILVALNAGAAPPDPQATTPEQRAEARRNVLVGMSIALVVLRRQQRGHTLPRTAMVAEPDPASYLRCTVGLKRTFPPRVPEGLAALYSTDSAQEARRSDR